MHTKVGLRARHRYICLHWRSKFTRFGIRLGLFFSLEREEVLALAFQYQIIFLLHGDYILDLLLVLKHSVHGLRV